jgi:antitoxin ParD1/3/4
LRSGLIKRFCCDFCLFEDEESKKMALRMAIIEGLDSPKVNDFDFDENLKVLKKKRIGDV